MDKLQKSPYRIWNCDCCSPGFGQTVAHEICIPDDWVQNLVEQLRKLRCYNIEVVWLKPGLVEIDYKQPGTNWIREMYQFDEFWV